MKTQVFIFVFVLFSSIGFTQNSDTVRSSKNAVYIELLGASGYWYNFSYDRIISSKNKDNFSLGVGLQVPPMSKLVREIADFSIAPQLCYLHGKKEFFEAGIGVFYAPADKSANLFLRIGYRAQIKNELFFKIAFTPFVGPIFFPSGGLALGWAF
jgi:hypothetical protein